MTQLNIQPVPVQPSQMSGLLPGQPASPFARPSGRMPQNFSPLQGARAPGQFVRGVRGLAVESNTLLSLGSYVLSGPGPATSPRDSDPDFSAKALYEGISSGVSLSEDELEYLLEADDFSDFGERLRKIGSERRYYEDVSSTGGWGMGVGLVSAILDPINFIPLVGPTRVGVGAVRMSKAGVRLSRIARASNLIRANVVRTAGFSLEAVAAEGILQATVQSQRVSPNSSEVLMNLTGAAVGGAVLPNVLLAGRGVGRSAKAGAARVRNLADRGRTAETAVGTELNQPTRVARDPSARSEDALAGRPMPLRDMLGQGISMLAETKKVISVHLFSPDGRGGFRRVDVSNEPNLVTRSGDRPYAMHIYQDGRHQVLIDVAAVRRDFDSKPWATADPEGKVTPLAEDAFATPEEWMDFVVVHEMVHANSATPKGLSSLASRTGFTVKELRGGWLEEAVNRDAMRILEEGGRELDGDGLPGTETLPFSRSGASPAPAPGAIQVHPQAQPHNAFQMHLRLQGYPKAVAEDAVILWSKVSPAVRAAITPFPAVRDLFSSLVPSPLRVVRSGSDDMRTRAPAWVRVQAWMASFDNLHLELRKDLRKLNKGKRGRDRLSMGEASSRLFAAWNKMDVDEVRDGWSPTIEKYARAGRVVMDELFEELQSLGLGTRVNLNEGESYLKRIWDLRKVRTPAFVEMLIDAGVKPKNAVKIQITLLSNADQGPKVFSSDRGTVRGRVLEELPFDKIRGFLQDDGLSVFRTTVRVYAGEIEAQKTLVEFMSRHGRAFDPAKIRTDDGNINLDYVLAVLDSQLRFAKTARGRISAEFLTRDVSQKRLEDIQEHYPELINSPEFEAVKNNPDLGWMGMSDRSLDAEMAAQKDILAMAIDHVRGREGLPQSPDSFLKTRLPSLLGNVSHMAFGGGVGLAALLDLPRVVGLFGMQRSLSSTLKPLMFSRGGAFRMSAEEARRAGLGMERLHGSYVRRMRNQGAHIKDEHILERAAAAGAEKMNILSGVSFVSDMHQMASGMATQSFIIDVVSRWRQGAEALLPSDRRILDELNMGPRELDVLSAEMSLPGRVVEDARGIKSINGTEWSPESRRMLSEILIESEYKTRSLPGRSELPVNSSDPWKRLLWMYRSWVVGNTNRILLSPLSGPDRAWATGIMAGIGLGAVLYSLKVQANLVAEPRSDLDWVAGAIDQSGVLGVLAEGNNLINRASGGSMGFGSQRYFSANSTMGAIIGPAWGLTRPATSAADGEAPDAMDVHRTRQVLPYNQVFYLKWLFDMIDPGVTPRDRE